MAVIILIQCAKDKAESFPKALQAIAKQIYMNDYVLSSAIIAEVKDTVRQVKERLQRGGVKLIMILLKRPEALDRSPCEDIMKSKDITLVLALKHNFVDDKFSIKALKEFPKNAGIHTRRKFFSLVASIFDRIGIPSPVTTGYKAAVQKI